MTRLGRVPTRIDRGIVRPELASMDVRDDGLILKQQEYLASWPVGS